MYEHLILTTTISFASPSPHPQQKRRSSILSYIGERMFGEQLSSRNKCMASNCRWGAGVARANVVEGTVWSAPFVLLMWIVL
jgi:hypothetical protein